MSKVIGTDVSSGSFHPFDSQKVLVHGKRLEAIVNERYYPPIVLNLDVTGKCQYRCGHCHHRSKQVRDRRLPDLSKRLARTLPYFLKNWKIDGYGIEACCIVGSQGDPLLYDDLPWLLKELHYTGIDVGVVTNGYGMTERLRRYLAFYSKFVGFSMDAGCADTYHKIKRCPNDAWDRVRSSIAALTTDIKQLGLRNDVGWKVLILPANQNQIYLSCRKAKAAGCRYVQIRPADLPREEQRKIDVNCVTDQIQKAIELLEKPNEFEVVGVRHKFTLTLEKVLPSYCYLTPLTVTVTSDGKAYACVDRRCDNTNLLCDCEHRGWRALEEEWSSSHHLDVVRRQINNNGRGPNCDIRCSNYGYAKFFENYFVEDRTDWKLI